MKTKQALQIPRWKHEAAYQMVTVNLYQQSCVISKKHTRLLMHSECGCEKTSTVLQAFCPKKPSLVTYWLAVSGHLRRNIGDRFILSNWKRIADRYDKMSMKILRPRTPICNCSNRRSEIELTAYGCHTMRESLGRSTFRSVDVLHSLVP